MIAMTLAETAAAVAGRLDGVDRAYRGVSTDTRTLINGQLFFALRGPNFDAHALLGAAAAAGAAGAVVERLGPEPASQVEVGDTRRALGRLARHWRARHTLPVLAVTGSAGKTTVKEMLAAILRLAGPVLATSGNLNNDIGVPQTLFRLDATHGFAVIEMGANQAGDIATLVEIAEPRVGIITLCAPAHLEGFGDLETVARTKGEIVAGLPVDGVAVINADDAYAPLWRALAGTRRVLTFGIGGDVRARDVDLGGSGSRFVLCCEQGEIAIELTHRGLHNVRNALAAAAGALAVGSSLEHIRAGLAAATLVAGRLQVSEIGHDARVIDDSYNANPASLAAAIDVLASEYGHRWLVLGDMAELGPEAAHYHHAAGESASRAGIERLFTLGQLARSAADGFGGTARHFDSRDELTAALREALSAVRGERTTVLIKGSRVMALDEVAAALCRSGVPAC